MKILSIPQRSDEWWQYKCGKISGTRYGKVVSTRDNKLKYELLDERDKGYIERDDYENEDMQFGNDQEPIARAEIIRTTGVTFDNGGIIVSDFFPEIHMHSSDGIFEGIVLEIKSTSDGAIHRRRFFEGPESNYMPQIINPFVCSDDVKEVWWYSWNPFVQIRTLIKHIFTRETILSEATKTKPAITIQDAVIEGRKQIGLLQAELKDMEDRFLF